MALTKKFFGANRAETYASLLEWLEEGPPVAVLEGFAGTGKTSLSSDLMRHVAAQKTWRGAIATSITEDASLADPILTVAARLSEDGETSVEDALFATSEPNYASVLAAALRQYVLVVVDEAQLLLDPSGRTAGDLAGVVESLATRSDLPGRLLLLSNRVVDRTSWPDVPILTLRDLSEDESEALLEERLRQAGVPGAVPQERKADVLAALARNPRAIEMLVTALRSEPLETILRDRPDLWAVHDREVSREFVDDLERMLLRRIIDRLPELVARNLRRLAAYRKEFEHDAVDRLCATPAEARELRRLLVDRFLLTHRFGLYALNPLVRAVALAQLKGTPLLLRKAHAHAAGYYLRYFDARRIVTPFDGLKGSFAELRYHLVQAGKTEQLDEVSLRYSASLEAELGRRQSLPEAGALDDRINLMLAVLEQPGPGSLEYHLARCLEKRGAPGDLEKAAVHAARATTAGAPVTFWTLRARIEAAVDPETALTTLRGAIAVQPASPLYDAAIRLLLERGLGDEAVATLSEALTNVPVAELSAELYAGCARWLWQGGRTAEALALLERGTANVPRETAAMLVSLHARFLSSLDRDEAALAVVQKGLARVPAESNAVVLHVFGADLLERLGRADDAESLLLRGIEEAPPTSYHMLYHRLGELLRDQERVDDAVRELRTGIAATPPESGVDQLYLLASDILDAAGELGAAVDLLREAVDVVPVTCGLPSVYLHLGYKLSRFTSARDGMEVLREGVRRSGRQHGGSLTSAALRFCVAAEDWSAFDEIVATDDTTEIDRDFAGVVRLNASGQYAAAAAVPLPEEGNRMRIEQAFALLCLGSSEAAWERIKPVAEFRAIIQEDVAAAAGLSYRLRKLALRPGEPILWLVTFIQLRRGRFDEAAQSLAALLGRAIAPHELNEATLLRVWDGELLDENNVVSLFFPVLPPSLTGRSSPVRRPPFGRSQLAETPAVAAAYQQAVEHLRARAHAQRTQTDVSCFVSYAWGNLQQEAWVRRLGADLEAAGIRVVADWNNSFIGSSVGRFVDSIVRTDFVLLVGTPLYVRKFENRDGHVVAAEYDMLAERLYGTEEQKASVLPIILEGTRKTAIPPGLAAARLAGDFTVAANYRANLLHLLRTLWRVPSDQTFLALEARVRLAQARAVDALKTTAAGV